MSSSVTDDVPLTVVTIRDVPVAQWRAFQVASRRSGRSASGMLRKLIRAAGAASSTGEDRRAMRR
jgi:hypothetical protein